MLRKITHVTVLSDYELLLTFNNNEKRKYDMSTELFGVFEELKDYNKFSDVRLINGHLTWLDELDLCSDSVYLDSKPYTDEE